jgi:hypothetical protein
MGQLHMSLLYAARNSRTNMFDLRVDRRKRYWRGLRNRTWLRKVVFFSVHDTNEIAGETEPWKLRIDGLKIKQSRMGRRSSPTLSPSQLSRKRRTIDIISNDAHVLQATLPTTGYVRQAELVGNCKQAIRGVIPFSSTTLWRKVADGSFPAPVKLSGGVTAWRVEDVHAWMAERS